MVTIALKFQFSRGFLKLPPPRPVFKWFHVSNLRSGTTDTCLREFITNTFHIDDLRCFRLIDGDNYNSFKVDIPVIHYDSFFNPSKWTAGVMVREFQYRRSKTFRRSGRSAPGPGFSR